jgi:hypothetical protein
VALPLEGELTLREIVLCLAGALVLYLLWLCAQLARLRKPGADAALSFSVPTGMPETIHSQILGGDPEHLYSSVHYDGPRPPEPSESPRAEPHLTRFPEPDAAPFGFDALLEVRQTRHLLDELLQKHLELQHEFSAIKLELQGLRAACQVSPVYGEAVALAQRGYDVDAIAERCGISVAEAQLVRSLSADAKKGDDND